MRKVLGLILLIPILAFASPEIPIQTTSGMIQDLINTTTGLIKKADVLTLDIPLSFTDEDGNITEFHTIESKMQDFTGKLVIINDQGYGGSIIEVNKFINVVQAVKTRGIKVIMNIIGPAASGHAYIACAADEVRYADGGSLLFHKVFGEDDWGVSTVLAHIIIPVKITTVDSQTKNLNEAQLRLCVASGILTKADVNIVSAGDDVVIFQSGNSRIKTYQPDDFDWTVSLTVLAKSIATVAFFMVCIGIIKKI